MAALRLYVSRDLSAKLLAGRLRWFIKTQWMVVILVKASVQIGIPKQEKTNTASHWRALERSRKTEKTKSIQLHAPRAFLDRKGRRGLTAWVSPRKKTAVWIFSKWKPFHAIISISKEKNRKTEIVFLICSGRVVPATFQQHAVREIAIYKILSGGIALRWEQIMRQKFIWSNNGRGSQKSVDGLRGSLHQMRIQSQTDQKILRPLPRWKKFFFTTRLLASV